MEGGGAGAPQPQQPASPTAGSRPNLTVPQLLAFGAFGLHALPALFASDNATVSSRVLVLALLPSDAGIRFGRALYDRSGSTPQPGIAQLKRI